VPEGTKVCVCV